MSLTLSCNGASSDAVCDVAEARVEIQHLGWLSLLLVSVLNIIY